MGTLVYHTVRGSDTDPEKHCPTPEELIALIKATPVAGTDLYFYRCEVPGTVDDDAGFITRRRRGSSRTRAR
jgi:hypothetical protein